MPIVKRLNLYLSVNYYEEMAISDFLKQIDDLKNKIDLFGKLSDEVLKKVNYKFRLDWNYHSNAMEGNSLTQQETRSVMINNVTIDGKPLKDVLEIKGHDKVISDILRIGKGELNLSEKRIKDIHRAIIHEDNIEQQKKVGQWKTEDNHLINYKGEKFDFVPNNEVPERMHALIDWLNKEVGLVKLNSKDALHPVLLAFLFHLRYVSIHPFYDGNGRTARILTNLILISFGYPPIIIKTNEKNVYNQYLADIQGYGGEHDLYLEFMCRQLINSLELLLNAIDGKEIDEPDDLDKKLLLLEKELEAIDPDNEVKERFSGDVFVKMYDDWISGLLKELIPVMQKFNRFFTGTRHHLSIQGASVSFENETAEEITNKFRIEVERYKNNINSEGDFRFSLHYGTLKKGGLHTFGCNYSFGIHFDYIKYNVMVDEFTETSNREVYQFNEKLLHQRLTKGEIDLLIKTLADTVYTHIDYNTKKSGIR